MGINKVDFGDETLIDLTEDTVTASKLQEGATAHNAAGDLIVGTMPVWPVTDNLDQWPPSGMIPSAEAVFRKLMERVPFNGENTSRYISIDQIITPEYTYPDGMQFGGFVLSRNINAVIKELNSNVLYKYMVDNELSQSSVHPVENRAVSKALGNKADKSAIVNVDELPDEPDETYNRAHVPTLDFLSSEDFITAFIEKATELGLLTAAPTEPLTAFSVADWSSGWQFKKGEETETVDLPHTCNTADGVSANYYRGDTEYTKTLTADEEKKYFLLVEGAGQKSTVYVDGNAVISYKGGYTQYVVPIANLATGEHIVKIKCDNSVDLTNIPISADFNFNNGLHRKVWLLTLSTAGFDVEEYGQDRFHLTQDDVSALSAQFTVKTKALT